MASPEFQPIAPRGPEFRPGTQAVSTPETVGRSVEAAPAPANLAPTPNPTPAPTPVDNSRTLVPDQAKRATFSLGRSTVKLPERADANRAVLVDQATRVVSDNKEDPALQKDELSRIMEAYRGIEDPSGSS